MSTANEFCPRCQTLREMRVTEKPSKEVDAQGKTQRVIIRNYHCAACNIFVRSETGTAAEK